jgi:hypothetical protein
VSELIENDEKLVGVMAQEIVDDYHALTEGIGPRGFGELKKPERQQVRESSLLWNGPGSAWDALLNEKGDRAVRAYVDRMLKLRARFPEEAAFVSPEGMNV